MSKAIRGNPDKDLKVKKWLKDTNELFGDISIYKNLNQSMLRDVGRISLMVFTNSWYHCDFRNEQGRGGLISAMKRKKVNSILKKAKF